MPLSTRKDFYLWVERRADLLRRGRFRDLDLAHLIEEVEDLGINLRNASRTREIILHLLKLQYSPAVEPRGGPYTLEQITDPIWRPDNVHRIEDPAP